MEQVSPYFSVTINVIHGGLFRHPPYCAKLAFDNLSF